MSEPIFQSSSSYHTERPHHRSIVGTAVVWGVVAIAAMMVFGLFAWAVGMVFHLIGLLFEVAVVTAVVALVWRHFSRRRGSRWS